ncbi:hypothetical protein GCM10009039_11580 [Halocalculus aciditolerans]|uniref:Uncharacterized protein n=1 Tax=Halocalculus aciditolerans TaxID=1383812 RepID=A0A830F276_9EURY|nr:hypothetical protein GCM10009039_11580 [Halocalculus aciditolerans]
MVKRVEVDQADERRVQTESDNVVREPPAVVDGVRRPVTIIRLVGFLRVVALLVARLLVSHERLTSPQTSLTTRSK